MAKANPIRFSTQNTDDETDLVCYLHRYYNPSMGKWASKDPINEPGFKLITGRRDKFVPEEEKNSYAFLDNDPVSDYDILGLSAGSAAGTCVGGLALVAASVPVGAIITGTVIIASMGSTHTLGRGQCQTGESSAIGH